MTSEMSAEPCEVLEWDSGLFGYRIGRVHGNVLTRHLLREIKAWAGANAVDCLYFFGQTDEYETVRLAEEAGLSLVDVRVTYERQLQSGMRQTPSERVRLFEPKDLPFLREIAQNSHTDSRFYFDWKFPKARCDELFKVWIERSCSGWADAVLVGLQDNEPAGYLTCHREPRENGKIGLVAVSGSARAKGLGAELLQSALQYFNSRSIQRVSVVTQGRNRTSQRLYQRAGFLTDHMQLTYHWWL
jgi:ribosomal protein S18 acetylase RimI-like enzyme